MAITPEDRQKADDEADRETLENFRLAEIYHEEELARASKKNQ